jgi:hypothetical protein
MTLMAVMVAGDDDVVAADVCVCALLHVGLVHVGNHLDLDESLRLDLTAASVV